MSVALPFGPRPRQRVVAGAVASTGRFVTPAAHHQHRTLAPWALEFEHGMEDSGQQLAAIAAQIARNRTIEVNLFQIGVHACCPLVWSIR